MKKLLMRAILCLIICIQFLFPFSVLCNRNGAFFTSKTTAKAATATPTSGTYACILSENTYFLSHPDTREGLFLLPKTYYVRLTDYNEDFCRVEYLTNDGQFRKITGYVKTSELTFVDYIPSRPYLCYLFDAKYTIEDGSFEGDSFLNQITVSCVYYGDFWVGSEEYCYVLQGDTFGYIPKPDDLYFEENTEYADRLQTPAPPTTENTSEKSSSSSPAQIAILVTLCLLIPILAALILKPPKRPPYEFDE